MLHVKGYSKLNKNIWCLCTRGNIFSKNVKIHIFSYVSNRFSYLGMRRHCMFSVQFGLWLFVRLPGDSLPLHMLQGGRYTIWYVVVAPPHTWLSKRWKVTIVPSWRSLKGKSTKSVVEYNKLETQGELILMLRQLYATKNRAEYKWMETLPETL